MNLLAAAGSASSPVRHVVVKSSTLVYGSSEKDPNTFNEDTRARRLPDPGRALTGGGRRARARLRRGQPGHPGDRAPLRQRARHRHPHVDLQEPLPPLCPSIFGYDPLVQFVEEDDVVRALEYVTASGSPVCSTRRAPGGSPGARWRRSAGPGWSLSRRWAPGWSVAPLARLGAVEFPPELESLLRYGRGSTPPG